MKVDIDFFWDPATVCSILGNVAGVGGKVRPASSCLVVLEALQDRRSLGQFRYFDIFDACTMRQLAEWTAQDWRGAYDVIARSLSILRQLQWDVTGLLTWCSARNSFEPYVHCTFTLSRTVRR